MWGKVRTAEARMAYDLGVKHPGFELDALDCGCSPSVVDWKYDREMSVLLALCVAEEALFTQFAFLDPSLLTAVHDHPEASSHKHFPVWPLMNLDTDNHPAPITAKLDLVARIVWTSGDDDPRGWEVEDLEGRRRWVGHLEEYLGPLWCADERAGVFWTEGLTWSDVTQLAIKEAQSLAELDKYVSALLQYAMNAFQRDYKMLPVPMFISPSLRGDLLCASCREKDVDGTVA